MISIIIPVYNAEKFLTQCLDSVLLQSYKNWECILVDDGSTDESRMVCDIYAKKDKRFTVYHINNSGSAAAREYGYKKATGEFLYFVDSDDWLDEKSLENQYECLKTTNADLCISSYYLFKDGINRKCSNKPSLLEKYTYIKELFGKNDLHGGLWCKMIRKKLMDDNSISFPQYNYYEDMYVTIALAMNARKICYNGIPSYYYRVNENSLTFSSRPELRFKNFNDFVLNMDDILSYHDLWHEKEIIRSFCGDVNTNKIKLLTLPYRYRREMIKALNFFPESYKVESINSIGSFFKLLALKYKIILPYHFILLIKKYKH